MKQPEPKGKKLPQLRYDFNKAVQNARAEHPVLKRKTVYVDAENDNWLSDVYGQKPVLAKNDDAVDEIEEAVEEARTLRSSFCVAVDAGRKKTMNAVVLHRDQFPLFDPTDRDIDNFGTFDHETGHALHDDIKGSHTMGENIADAYAVLRHFQRYAGQETNIEYCGWKRALVFMLSGVDTHLTTFTVDKITIDAKTADFMSLTPKQTAAIAHDYAALHAPKAKALKKLKDDFKPLKKKRFSAETFRTLAKITLAAPEGSDTFYLGARVLAPALKDGSAYYEGKTLSLQGREWAALSQKLDDKIARLPKNHALRVGFG